MMVIAPFARSGFIAGATRQVIASVTSRFKILAWQRNFPKSRPPSLIPPFN
jgi:hypothetical protein